MNYQTLIPDLKQIFKFNIPFVTSSAVLDSGTGRMCTKDLSRTEVCFTQSRNGNVNKQLRRGLKSKT